MSGWALLPVSVEAADGAEGDGAAAEDSTAVDVALMFRKYVGKIYNFEFLKNQKKSNHWVGVRAKLGIGWLSREKMRTMPCTCD